MVQDTLNGNTKYLLQINCCYHCSYYTTTNIHIPIKSQEDFQTVQSLQKAIMFWTSSASKPSMSRDSVWNCNQIMKSVQLYTPIASCTLEIRCGVLHQDLHVHNLQACCNPWSQHSSDLELPSVPAHSLMQAGSYDSITLSWCCTYM